MEKIKRGCKKVQTAKRQNGSEKETLQTEFVTKMKKNFKLLKFFFLYMPFCLVRKTPRPHILFVGGDLCKSIKNENVRGLF